MSAHQGHKAPLSLSGRCYPIDGGVRDSRAGIRMMLAGLGTPPVTVLGAFLGFIGFLRIILWHYLGWANYHGHPYLMGVTVWASLVGVVLFGSVVGSMLPFLLRKFGFDPATSSAPFVATLVDVTGLIIYFCVAKVILSGTLL